MPNISGLQQIPISVLLSTLFLLGIMTYQLGPGIMRRIQGRKGQPPLDQTRIRVWGSHAECSISHTLAVQIIEHIDPAGIYPSQDRMVLDGCKLADIAERGIPGLSLLDRRALSRIDDLATETAALSMSAQVQLIGCPTAVLERSQERAREAGSAYVDAVTAIAVQASAMRAAHPRTEERRPAPVLLII